MKHLLLYLFLLAAAPAAMAQKTDSIRYNLYTDSLKKGTWNYINVEVRYANGRYLPATSNELVLTCSDSNGKIEDNSVWIPADFTGRCITVTAKLKNNPALFVTRTIYIKQKPDDEKLKTPEEILRDLEKKQKRKG